MWKKMKVMIYVDVFSRHSPRKTSENHEIHSQDSNNPAEIWPQYLPKPELPLQRDGEFMWSAVG